MGMHVDVAEMHPRVPLRKSDRKRAECSDVAEDIDRCAFKKMQRFPGVFGCLSCQVLTRDGNQEPVPDEKWCQIVNRNHMPPSL